MATRRRFSRDIRLSRLAGRDDIATLLEAVITAALKECDPALPVYGVRIASAAAAIVASQIAVQTQVNQRALLSIEDDIAGFATDFVNSMVFAATKSVSKKLKHFHAETSSNERVMQLADDWAGPVAGPTAIERHYGIPRSTLYRWQKRNEAVALSSRTSSKPVFPLRQFLDGRPMEGIAEVIEIFGNPREAWKWLIDASDKCAGVPIDLLARGQINVVLDAARRECQPS